MKLLLLARILLRLSRRGVEMSPVPERVKDQVHSMTVDTSIVSIREPLDHLPATVRAIASFQRSLWPLMVITVAALSSVLWTIALLWLVGNAIW
jgi:hypothetical protein